MIDTNGNGQLSWDECYQLCHASLDLFHTNDNSEFIRDMSRFFADFIFKSVGRGHDEEIPFAELQNIVLTGSGDEAELIGIFCGTDHYGEDDIRKESEMDEEEHE